MAGPAQSAAPPPIENRYRRRSYGDERSRAAEIRVQNRRSGRRPSPRLTRPLAPEIGVFQQAQPARRNALSLRRCGGFRHGEVALEDSETATRIVGVLEIVLPRQPPRHRVVCLEIEGAGLAEAANTPIFPPDTSL
jgi:hypothetical protein